MPSPLPNYPPPPEFDPTFSPEYRTQKFYESVTHLRSLGIAYYVLAVLSGIGTICGGMWVGFMVFFMAVEVNSKSQTDEVATAILFVAILIILASLLFGVLMALLQFFTGKFLREGRRHTFCTVVSVITSLNFPLGTIIGVMTLVMLNRDGISDYFKYNDRTPRA